MTALAALARAAPVPVFCAVGSGRARARDLHLDRRLRLVRSPRHAAVLLVVGRIPAHHHDALRRVHDQVCAPRATVAWGATAGELPLPEAVRVPADEDPGAALRRVHEELMDGRRDSTPTLGPTENPVSWQGEGPHGQGGEGMMGGKPYGRPLAMTGPDVRDGLHLDRVSLTLGPFLPWLPPGVRLSLELQGDVLQSLEIDAEASGRSDEPDVFAVAAEREVRLADLEVARARHQLGVVADLLLLSGLDALARRTLRLARDARPGDGDRVRSLEGTLGRTRALALATRGIGRLPGARLRGLGPAARASGEPEDARANDPAYRDLGFATLTHAAGDAEARWRQRLAEAAQSLDLAARAGERTRAPGPDLENVRGAAGDPSDVRALLTDRAPGTAFDAFATTLVSLDPDLAKEARRG